MPGRVTLRVMEGPIRGQVFAFSEHDTFLFGRGLDCHARLPESDPTASRHHFLLEVNPPDARLRDLGSLNGTYVNDARHGGRAGGETAEAAARRSFPAVDLGHDDRIRVGETVFQVEVALPVSCDACGQALGLAPPAEAAGGRRCAACQRKAAAPPRAEPIRCTSCGKDAAAEAGPARRGAYLCQACQAQARRDPAPLLLRLLAARGAGRQAPAGPAIPGYAIERLLGTGGMGAVYAARRLADGASVAIKVLLARVAVDAEARQKFQREIEVTQSLRHPNLVALLDHGSAGSGFYFAMELCPGGGVDGLLQRRGGRLPVAEALAIVLQALKGLIHAHNRGFVHRDLKPQNLLLTAPEGGTAKIADFGMAKSWQKAGLSGMTALGTAGGTLAFMPREQLTNFREVKPASDVFSMGATLYFLLTGEPPRDFPPGRDPMEVILRDGTIPIRQRRPDLPAPLAEVLERALADRPTDRYPTAIPFYQALAKAG